MPRLLVVSLLVLAVASSGLLEGCAHTAQVRVEGEHDDVVVGGVHLGKVPAGGAPVEVPLGTGPVTVEVRHDGVSSIGSVARTEPVWWVVAAGIAGAMCCVPTLATGGFCLANPGALGAPLAFAVTADVGALTGPCAAPSWATLPVVTACAGAGLSPLLVSFAAETVPDDITIRAPAPTAPTTAMVY
jgi:hypothetical protein